MGIGTAVQMLFFNVLLSTADVFSDIYLTLKLFTGYHLTKNHPKFGALTLVPLMLSFIGMAIKWFKIETMEGRNKLKMLPLLIFQFYPQWRALRVIYYARIKKDRRWKAMKEEFEDGISHLGKHCQCNGKMNLFRR